MTFFYFLLPTNWLEWFSGIKPDVIYQFSRLGHFGEKGYCQLQGVVFKFRFLNYYSWNHQKTINFLMISEGIEVDFVFRLNSMNIRSEIWKRLVNCTNIPLATQTETLTSQGNKWRNDLLRTNHHITAFFKKT